MPAVSARIAPDSQRNFPRWLDALARLPEPDTDRVTLDQPIIATSPALPLNTAAQQSLQEALMGLHPWRKGPFNLHGTFIDTEWRCDKKWDRLAQHIDLKNRNVLDVGSGNGYYGLRMLGAGARSVIGLDTSLLYCTQFQAITHFTGDYRSCVLPVGVEVLLDHHCTFDTIFSMGVLYHRRQPIEHLELLRSCLADGGQLVLETLIIEGDSNNELVPSERYANMRNVWSLPSVPFLLQQLSDAGFSNARCIDTTQTTSEEQRSTPWMTFHSLEQALDPENQNLTVEGHPAPIRAVVLAEK